MGANSCHSHDSCLSRSEQVYVTLWMANIGRSCQAFARVILTLFSFFFEMTSPQSSESPALFTQLIESIFSEIQAGNPSRSLASSAATEVQGPKPNILFLLVDELRFPSQFPEGVDDAAGFLRKGTSKNQKDN
jgi:hypothetical protein